MSRIRCFLNGDPKNFYYVSDKVADWACDENDNYLGDPLTESGLVENGCVIIPSVLDEIYGPSPYDAIADGRLTKENIASFYRYNTTPQSFLNRHWDRYKAIIDNGAYTKENGFDIQKLKEMGFTYTSSKPTDETNPNDSKCDENTKTQYNEILDLHTLIEKSVKSFFTKNEESGDNSDLIINSWMNILTVYLKALAWENEDEIGEEDLFFEDKFSNLSQILNIRTISFFVKDKDEKLSVLDSIEQVLLADTEEGKEYRRHLDSRQLWMMEYQDQKNFVLETPVISSDDKKGLGKETSKLRFIFSSDTVKVKEFFVFSDTEDTGLSMDALVDFG